MIDSENWPAVKTSKEVHAQIEDLQNSEGFFRGMNQIEIMKLGAAHTIKNGLSAPAEHKRETDISAPKYVASKETMYVNLRMLMLLCYSTDSGIKISDDFERIDIVKTFERFAEAGIRDLHDKYIIGSDTPEDFLRLAFEDAQSVKPAIEEKLSN
ncbi:MAG TPA: hypothetical protein PKB09_02045 [Candidatus Saccharibacteria bacterium]|nr:hypothetical protein [Candidatus Saccharibacteria bacterium]